MVRRARGRADAVRWTRARAGGRARRSGCTCSARDETGRAASGGTSVARCPCRPELAPPSLRVADAGHAALLPAPRQTTGPRSRPGPSADRARTRGATRDRCPRTSERAGLRPRPQPVRRPEPRSSSARRPRVMATPASPFAHVRRRRRAARHRPRGASEPDGRRAAPRRPGSRSAFGTGPAPVAQAGAPQARPGGSVPMSSEPPPDRARTRCRVRPFWRCCVRRRAADAARASSETAARGCASRGRSGNRGSPVAERSARALPARRRLLHRRRPGRRADRVPARLRAAADLSPALQPGPGHLRAARLRRGRALLPRLPRPGQGRDRRRTPPRGRGRARAAEGARGRRAPRVRTCRTRGCSSTSTRSAGAARGADAGQRRPPPHPRREPRLCGGHARGRRGRRRDAARASSRSAGARRRRRGLRHSDERASSSQRRRCGPASPPASLGAGHGRHGDVDQAERRTDYANALERQDHARRARRAGGPHRTQGADHRRAARRDDRHRRNHADLAAHGDDESGEQERPPARAQLGPGSVRASF